MTMSSRSLANLLDAIFIAGFSATAMAAPQLPIASHDRSIVFVCEHGAALSVIATRLCNNLAAARGLPQRAVYRGVDPAGRSGRLIDFRICSMKTTRSDAGVPTVLWELKRLAGRQGVCTAVFANPNRDERFQHNPHE